MRIIHPRPALGRQKFIGVEFRDGEAVVEELHPEVEAALLQHGFTIEKVLVVDGTDAPFEPLPTVVDGDTSEKVSKRRSKRAPVDRIIDGIEITKGDDALILKIDGGEWIFSYNDTVADVRKALEVGDDTDLWLETGDRDIKVADDWTLVNDSIIRTAPRFINGG